MNAARASAVIATVILGVGCGQRAGAADDRLILGANATRVAGTDGGGGEMDWLHGVDDLGTMSLGVDYQSLAGAKWAYASLSGAATPRGGAGSLTASAELHEGAGRIGTHNFDYNIVAAALGTRLSPALFVQFEDRQIEVDTTHGNLPKLTLSAQGGRRWLADVSFAQSISGNLRTRMGVAHADWDLGIWSRVPERELAGSHRKSSRCKRASVCRDRRYRSSFSAFPTLFSGASCC